MHLRVTRSLWIQPITKCPRLVYLPVRVVNLIETHNKLLWSPDFSKTRFSKLSMTRTKSQWSFPFKHYTFTLDSSNQFSTLLEVQKIEISVVNEVQNHAPLLKFTSWCRYLEVKRAYTNENYLQGTQRFVLIRILTIFWFIDDINIIVALPGQQRFSIQGNLAKSAVAPTRACKQRQKCGLIF